MADFREFLFKRSVKNTESKECTHTRIPDKNLNIYPGSYNIPDELLPTFYNLYYENVFIQKNKEYLTEKQLNGKCIAIDLDFRYSHEITNRQHTKDDISNIVCLYLDGLKEYLEFNNDSNFDVFVFEKPNVNRLEDGSLTKDGIHIIIGLRLDNKIQVLLRKKMLDILPNDINLPLINSWESVLDEGISKGHTNWQLFGSRKPGNEAYELTGHFEVTFDEADSNFMMDERKVCDFDLKNNFQKLSVQYNGNPQYPLKIEFEENPEVCISKVTHKTSNENLKVTEINKSYYQLLVHGIGNKNFEYKDWLKICSWCVSHISKTDYLNYIDDNWKEKAEEMWDSLSKYGNNCPIYFLEKLAKEINPEYYRNWRIEHKQYLKLKILDKGSNDVARFISKKLKLDLVYCNDSWIMFDKITSLWRIVKRPDAIITTHIQREIDQARESLLYVKNKLESDEERFKLTKIEKMYLVYYNSVSNGGYCSQIIKYLTEYLYDSEFMKQLDNYKYKIVFKDGILDLKTLKFKKGIYQEDFISKTIPFNYQEPSQEEKNFVKTQLKKICNWNDAHLDYYLSTLGYAMTGDSDKEQMFYYLRGQTAENGKSLIFETLEKIMPNYVSKGTSNILDKGSELKKEIPTWKGLLILWLNELSNKIKDEDLVKSICDGTDYKFGKNYATEAEKIRIGFKLFAVSNNSISVKGDEGIKRRFKLEQFNSQFKEDNKEDNFKTLQFIKDKNLGDKLCNEYKHALIHLIFEYSNLYFKEKELKPYPPEWKEQATENLEENDKFKSWFDVNIVVDVNGKIAKQVLESIIPKDIGFIKIVDELTRMKIPYTYKSQERIGSKKGVYLGIRSKTTEELIKDECEEKE
jgi:hypothetical protein